MAGDFSEFKNTPLPPFIQIKIFGDLTYITCCTDGSDFLSVHRAGLNGLPTRSPQPLRFFHCHWCLWQEQPMARSCAPLVVDGTSLCPAAQCCMSPGCVLFKHAGQGARYFMNHFEIHFCLGRSDKEWFIAGNAEARSQQGWVDGF